MTRLAENRETHLSPAEIAAEALRQFDEEPSEPTIRSLATALRVAPSAIYHHYPSRSAIVQSAVELAWAEATRRLLEEIPRPLEGDPEDVLVATGVATRRTWLAHNRLAAYMAASPESNEFTARALGLMGSMFERLGLDGDDAAAGFYTYSSFMPNVTANTFPILLGDLRGVAFARRIGFSVVVHRDSNYQGKGLVGIHGRVRWGSRVIEPWRLKAQKVST